MSRAHSFSKEAMEIVNRDDLSPEAKMVIEACNAVRAAGYVVVSSVEHEMWSDWLRASHERNRKAHDETQQLIWQHGHLIAQMQKQLAGTRPRWYRDARRWWLRAGWTDPVQ